MVVLNLKLDGVYGFNHFEINFTYPKKVVNSIIDDEHLEDRERFRYKKAVILMGTNATGKTSMGRALLKIFNYINTGNLNHLLEMASEDRSSFEIDFVNNGCVLHRLAGLINKTKDQVDVTYQSAEIEKTDFYEKCVNKLADHTAEVMKDARNLKNMIGEIHYRFAYPEIEPSLKLAGTNQKNLLKMLQAVIGTLDPTLKDISISRDLKHTFIIRRKNQEIIIQEGKLLNRDVLSSGTAEGIDVALFLASMMSTRRSFYYCDEHFSYIQSDIEKMIFTLMMERIQINEQLIFTTHNTDLLEINLPKHSFVFLRKELEDGEYRVSAMSASDVLKRNTDSVKCAMENDVFESLPDLSKLAELDLGWSHE